MRSHRNGWMWAIRAATCTALISAGCGNTVPVQGNPGLNPGATNDATSEIGGAQDTAPAVTPVADAGGAVDSAVADAGPTDAGGPVDSGVKDTGPVDIGVVDTGPKDTADSNKPCSFTGEIGATGLECVPGETCLPNVGTCSGKVEGLCKKLNATCPTQTNAVCGCDGNTYINVCEAQKVGMIIKHGGKCQSQVLTPCGGKTGGTCPMGQTCDIDGCDKDSSGFCYAEPPNNQCPNGGVPECGCDDKTYPNGCYRRAAGVAKQQLGECFISEYQPCMIGPAGKEVQPCSAGKYCQVDPKNPDPCVGKGECKPIPPVCDKTSAPVCSCGGFSKILGDFYQSGTYTNACELAKTGIGMKSTGACGGGDGSCTEGNPGDCLAGQYCGVSKGNCGTKGVCIKKPDPPCPNTVSLVCGCDNKTYSNAGCAAEAGVIVSHDGPC